MAKYPQHNVAMQLFLRRKLRENATPFGGPSQCETLTLGVVQTSGAGQFPSRV